MARVFTFLLVAGSFVTQSFAACLDSHSFTLDEHGTGSEIHYAPAGPPIFCSETATSLSYQVGTDPSGGITNRSVLIYSSPSGSLDFGINGGDVALVSTNAAGSNVISHLIRFRNSDASPGGKIIVYAADNSGSLADSGIPASSNPVQIPDHPGGATSYYPSSTQPGYSIVSSMSYTFYTEPVSPVFVLSTNRLSINLDTNGVTVSWSTNATNFALFQSTNIFRATNWIAVTNSPVISNEQTTVSFPAPVAGNLLFRLIQQ
jgi:hypothetical protein